MSLAADHALKQPASMPRTKGNSIFQDLREFLKEVTGAKHFWPIASALGGLCLFYLTLLGILPDLWMNNDHYSHGFIIPLFSGYALYKSWPKIKDTPVKAGWLALPFLLGFLVLGWASMRVDQEIIASGTFLGAILCTAWLLAGFRWMLKVFNPVAYLAFCLPVWLSFIDTGTVPLQLMSTKGAFQLLALMRLGPQRDDMHPTDIYLNHFSLNVAVPCSGMKLLLAITAFTVFFLMIADIKWWARLIMAAAVLPLSLATNSLRIALIGLVGNSYGEQAGHQFHDYSGYLTLLVCFFALFKLAKVVGWKD